MSLTSAHDPRLRVSLQSVGTGYAHVSDQSQHNVVPNLIWVFNYITVSDWNWWRNDSTWIVLVVVHVTPTCRYRVVLHSM